MGHITKLKLQHNAGALASVSEIEGSMDASELGPILRSIRQQDLEPAPECSPDVETCQVPRENLAPTEDGPPGSFDRLLETASRNAADLDAARGAVRLMAESVGIESGEGCNVAKLAKQVNAILSSWATQYLSMDSELANLRGAMVRFRMPEVPEPEDGQELTDHCQVLAHHMDVLGNAGFSCSPTEKPSSAPDGAPMSRDDRLSALAAAQQEAQRMMIDLAVLDGFVAPGMPAPLVMAKTMEWAKAMDAAGGVKVGEPERGEPVASDGLTLGVTPEQLADQGGPQRGDPEQMPEKSVAELIGVRKREVSPECVEPAPPMNRRARIGIDDD